MMKSKENCYLDAVITVVDAIRLKEEFQCGNSLKKENIDEMQESETNDNDNENEALNDETE